MRLYVQKQERKQENGNKRVERSCAQHINEHLGTENMGVREVEVASACAKKKREREQCANDVCI
jgi:hypothetical protein